LVNQFICSLKHLSGKQVWTVAFDLSAAVPLQGIGATKKLIRKSDELLIF